MWTKTSLLAALGMLAALTFPTAPVSAGSIPCPTLLQGDMDADGDVDYDDLVLFDEAYAKGDLSADWNFNCVVDEGDVGRFVRMYLLGGASILDFNLNGVVNILDLDDFYTAWLDGFNGGGTTANVTNRYLGQGDCVVNFVDLQVFNSWFQNCPWQ